MTDLVKRNVGSEIIESLKQAVEGNFARVTIEGQTWVRVEELVETKARIEQLEAEIGTWEHRYRCAVIKLEDANGEIGLVEVRDAGAKGRGVFAFKPIAAGTIIETAPIKPFDFTQALPKELDGLPIHWTDKEDAIALGLTQLVNHSNNPNCELVNNLADLTVSLVAIRDIQIGEELSYIYDCELWFEVLP